jgi:hypothetical protein
VTRIRFTALADNGAWITGPLQIEARGNLTLYFDANARLEALPGAYSTGEAIINVRHERGTWVRFEHEATALDIVGSPEHLQMRTERSKPAVADFYDWVSATRATTLPKSPLGEALTYASNQRDRLELFLTDARIPIHNNASERRLRVVALGRKNYLFVGHPRAGRNIAAAYSLVGCCIANRVEPTEYLTDVLPRIALAKTDAELDALLPDRWRPSGPAP